jgi:hypothetical protein
MGGGGGAAHLDLDHLLVHAVDLARLRSPALCFLNTIRGMYMYGRFTSESETYITQQHND